jgi:hypothetical protein
MSEILTFEIDNSGEEIVIHGTPEKLRWLAEKINKIASYAENNKDTHDHLMAPSWGGDELTEIPQATDGSSTPAKKVTIYSWPNEKNS